MFHNCYEEFFLLTTALIFEGTLSLIKLCDLDTEMLLGYIS